MVRYRFGACAAGHRVFTRRLGFGQTTGVVHLEHTVGAVLHIGHVAFDLSHPVVEVVDVGGDVGDLGVDVVDGVVGVLLGLGHGAVELAQVDRIGSFLAISDVADGSGFAGSGVAHRDSADTGVGRVGVLAGVAFRTTTVVAGALPQGQAAIGSGAGTVAHGDGTLAAGQGVRPDSDRVNTAGDRVNLGGVGVEVLDARTVVDVGDAALDGGDTTIDVGDLGVGLVELRHVHRIAVIHAASDVGDLGAARLGHAVIGVATQGDAVMGAVVVHHRIGDRCGRGRLQLGDVHRVGSLCPSRQAGDTAITDVHFTIRGATHHVGLIA
ncbi:hypothetical protein D3C76_757110 [compost metagenome]